MSRHYREFALDDDDLIGEGVLSGEELAKASKEFERLRSDKPKAWEKESEERSI